MTFGARRVTRHREMAMFRLGSNLDNTCSFHIRVFLQREMLDVDRLTSMNLTNHYPTIHSSILTYHGINVDDNLIDNFIQID